MASACRCGSSLPAACSSGSNCDRSETRSSSGRSLMPRAYPSKPGQRAHFQGQRAARDARASDCRAVVIVVVVVAVPVADPGEQQYAAEKQPDQAEDERESAGQPELAAEP